MIRHLPVGAIFFFFLLVGFDEHAGALLGYRKTGEREQAKKERFVRDGVARPSPLCLRSDLFRAWDRGIGLEGVPDRWMGLHARVLAQIFGAHTETLYTG